MSSASLPITVLVPFQCFHLPDKVYLDTQSENYSCSLIAFNPCKVHLLKLLKKSSNALFITPFLISLLRCPWLHSPQLQWVTNPACSTTGVFLVVNGWKALTSQIYKEKQGITNKSLEEGFHLWMEWEVICLITNRWWCLLHGRKCYTVPSA